MKRCQDPSINPPNLHGCLELPNLYGSVPAKWGLSCFLTRLKIPLILVHTAECYTYYYLMSLSLKTTSAASRFPASQCFSQILVSPWTEPIYPAQLPRHVIQQASLRSSNPARANALPATTRRLQGECVKFTLSCSTHRRAGTCWTSTKNEAQKKSRGWGLWWKIWVLPVFA